MAAANGTGKATKAALAVRQTVREIIGRWGGDTLYQSLGGLVDVSVPDYRFWDNFRRGRAVGYELSGLFARPITQMLTGWVLGSVIKARLPSVSDAAQATYTEDLVNRFLARIHGPLETMVNDLYGLGNQYVVVNADGSLSIPSPETVKKENDPVDYRKPVRYTITTDLGKISLTDVYTAERRTITAKTSDTTLAGNLIAGGWEQIEPTVYQREFPNLIGKLPIVHFTNDRSSNETHGRPIYEALLNLFKRYSRLLNKMVNGAELMGQPIPTFEGLEDVEGTVEANSEPVDDHWTDADGTQRKRLRIPWDKIPALFIGKGGSFKFAAPPNGFTDDIRNTLKSLFLLVLEFTRIPEGMWGTELASARATFEEQMIVFRQFITSLRVALAGQGADDALQDEAQGGLLELLDIWLRTRALTDRQVMIVPVALEWEPLTQDDAKLTHQQANDAFDRRTITAKTYNETLPFVKHAEQEAQDAEAEAQNGLSQGAKDGQKFDQTMNDLANQPNDAAA